MINDDTTVLSNIALTNFPNNFGLVEAKKLIQNHLADTNAVISVAYDRNRDGQVLKTTIIAQLRDSAGKGLLSNFIFSTVSK